MEDIEVRPETAPVQIDSEKCQPELVKMNSYLVHSVRNYLSDKSYNSFEVILNYACTLNLWWKAIIYYSNLWWSLGNFLRILLTSTYKIIVELQEEDLIHINSCAETLSRLIQKLKASIRTHLIFIVVLQVQICRFLWKLFQRLINWNSLS